MLITFTVFTWMFAFSPQLLITDASCPTHYNGYSPLYKICYIFYVDFLPRIISSHIHMLPLNVISLRVFLEALIVAHPVKMYPTLRTLKIHNRLHKIQRLWPTLSRLIRSAPPYFIYVRQVFLSPIYAQIREVVSFFQIFHTEFVFPSVPDVLCAITETDVSSPYLHTLCSMINFNITLSSTPVSTNQCVSIRGFALDFICIFRFSYT